MRSEFPDLVIADMIRGLQSKAAATATATTSSVSGAEESTTQTLDGTAIATATAAVTASTDAVAVTVATASRASPLSESEEKALSIAANLLSQLGVLENTHATAVASCRARDASKGREIIPDYDSVNPVGSDVYKDAVVAEARDQAAAIAVTVRDTQRRLL
jgi:hypothetical protein